MRNDVEHFRALIYGMRAAYGRGDNAMDFARNQLADTVGRSNLLAATLIAYDLQTGTYTAGVRANPEANRRWCNQLSDLIRTVLPRGGRILEVGTGEATTLAGVVSALGADLGGAYGFDLSWSRVAEGQEWLAERGQEANLFVGDLFEIPLADSSIDVVYSSHSLEPNGGWEEAAIAECLRVAREAVVLVEPSYELAKPEARARMEHHGYVRGLRETAERLGAKVLEHRLLAYCPNSLNPSGVLILAKQQSSRPTAKTMNIWRCPLTGASLEAHEDVFYAPDVGIAYPILRGVPLLRGEHAVVASKCR